MACVERSKVFDFVERTYEAVPPRKPRRLSDQLRQRRLKQLLERKRIIEQLIRLNVPPSRLTPIRKYAQRLGRSV